MDIEQTIHNSNSTFAPLKTRSVSFAHSAPLHQHYASSESKAVTLDAFM